MKIGLYRAICRAHYELIVFVVVVWSLFAQHERNPQPAVLPSILLILTFLGMSGGADPPSSVGSDQKCIIFLYSAKKTNSFLGLDEMYLF